MSTAYSKERLMNVLLAPHVTEKTALAMQNGNQYTFRVRRDSTKPEIKAAVELMFDVTVDGVQVANEPGKVRRAGLRVFKALPPGLSHRVVRAALDDFLEEHVQVVPSCWFVAEVIEAHEAYRSLVEPDSE